MLVRAYGIADQLMVTKCCSEILVRIRDFFDCEHIRPRHLLVIDQLELSKEDGLVQFVTDQLVFEMSRGVGVFDSPYKFDGFDGELFTAGSKLVVVVVEKMMKTFGCLKPTAEAKSTWWSSSPASDTTRRYH